MIHGNSADRAEAWGNGRSAAARPWQPRPSPKQWRLPDCSATGSQTQAVGGWRQPDKAGRHVQWLHLRQYPWQGARTASAMASAVACQRPSMSRSTKWGLGNSWATLRRATDSTMPSTSKITALGAVSPLSIPSRLGISSAFRFVDAERHRWRDDHIDALAAHAGHMVDAVASSTITASNSVNAAKLCKARRVNLV